MSQQMDMYRKLITTSLTRLACSSGRLKFTAEQILTLVLMLLIPPCSPAALWNEQHEDDWLIPDCMCWSMHNQFENYGMILRVTTRLNDRDCVQCRNGIQSIVDVAAMLMVMKSALTGALRFHLSYGHKISAIYDRKRSFAEANEIIVNVHCATDMLRFYLSNLKEKLSRCHFDLNMRQKKKVFTINDS